MQRQGDMSSGVSRSDAMPGTASGSGLSNEERTLDVLALPAADPRSINFSISSFSQDAAPLWGAIRRSRPDRNQEIIDLQRQLAEARGREIMMESTMAERARAYGLHERSEADARIETVQNEARAAIAWAEEVARGQELLAQNAAYE